MGARRALRAEWGVRPQTRLVGMVGRLDPMKDHPTFLRAAAELAAIRDDVRFVSVGDGRPEYQHMLRDLARSLGLGSQIWWEGARSGMPAVYSALDILTSSSAFGEGFSNTVAEAMACETPCVVTDVGDSAMIVGKSGQVVPPGDARALAAAWTRLLDLPEAELAAIGAQSRARIVEHFGVERMVARTEAVYEELGRR